MVVQYPHKLYKAKVANSASKDADGNWSQQDVTMEYLGVCRHETVGKGTKFNLGGGRYIEAGSTIYCPKNEVELHPGEFVVVYAGDTELVRGEVLGFSNDQLHQRVWI